MHLNYMHPATKQLCKRQKHFSKNGSNVINKQHLLHQSNDCICILTN